MSAILSQCRRYRFLLSRVVNEEKGLIYAYFGINPSTADESIDDATVCRWKGFTLRNSGSKFYVGNVFAYRATDVNELKSVDDPVGANNMKYLRGIIECSDILVPCWGAKAKLPKELRSHLDSVLNLLLSSDKPVMCFGKTSAGDPRHPLMLPYSTKLEHW